MFFTEIDSRILALAQKLAGDKWDVVQIQAEDLVKQGKSTERALADALEMFKLV